MYLAKLEHNPLPKLETCRRLKSILQNNHVVLKAHYLTTTISYINISRQFQYKNYAYTYFLIMQPTKSTPNKGSGTLWCVPVQEGPGEVPIALYRLCPSTWVLVLDFLLFSPPHMGKKKSYLIKLFMDSLKLTLSSSLKQSVCF